MKKAMPLFCLLFCLVISLGIFSFSSLGKSDALNVVGEAKVIVSRCYLYTASTFNSDKVTYVEDENTVLVVLNHGEKVNVQSFDGDFAFVKTANEKEGFVYRFYLTDNESQSVYPVFNGTIRKDTTIFDIDIKATEYTAKKNTRVYLYQGFDDKKEYTAVQVVLEDESLYNGFILTSDIKPDGVSGVLIVAISIIVAAVTIILSLLYIKKKRPDKKK